MLHLPFMLVPFEEPEAPAGPKRPALEMFSLPEIPAAQSSAQLPANASDLCGWLRLANPSQWYFPNDVEGFSRFNRVQNPHPLPAWPTFTLEPHPLERYLFAPVRLSVPTPSASNLIQAGWQDYRTIITTVPTVPAPLPHKVVWRGNNGLPLKNPPALSQQVLKLWDTPETRDALRDTTRIAIQFRTDLSTPRLVLLQSCGVPALDAGAAAALRNYLRNNSLNQVTTPQNFVIETDWFF